MRRARRTAGKRDSRATLYREQHSGGGAQEAERQVGAKVGGQGQTGGGGEGHTAGPRVQWYARPAGQLLGKGGEVARVRSADAGAAATGSVRTVVGLARRYRQEKTVAETLSAARQADTSRSSDRPQR